MMDAPSLALRVGVDVGGTFTKAVAIDLTTRALVATSIVSTTHAHAGGVAHGVVQAVADVAQQVGASNIALVTHSTTQAVNALLEGDVGVVGVIGLARQPDLSAALKRTRLADVEIASGKRLAVKHAFFDVGAGLPTEAVLAVLTEWKREGVSAVCVAEAFAPDDVSNERAVVDMARDLELPVCASTDLSGLYGLELRAVTAALNASILPIAVATAGYVAAGVREAGISAPVMVMRSDGGATDLQGFSSAPVRTLYSGPAASVAGALRHSGVTDAIVIEVGGTSTNIAGIRNGQPSLAYVRVASHATALRSVDVRVVGVAGGSMLRVRNGKVHGVGPRSAHIAGMAYASFLSVEELDGATPELVGAKSGDPDDYLVLRLRDGRRVALTNTCAANALGITEIGDYAYAPCAAAIAAFASAATILKIDGPTIATRMLRTSGEAVCELALAVAKSSKLEAPTIVGVGGGAGGLARYAATMLGWTISIPDDSEVISSIGDALSLLRAERERSVAEGDVSVIGEMMEAVEREVLNAGASPNSIEVRLEEVPERSTMRAVAIGSIGLSSGAVPGREARSDEEIRTLVGADSVVTEAGNYWLAAQADHSRLFDRFGQEVLSIHGTVVALRDLPAAIEQHTRYRGPMTLKPTVWIIDQHRLIELASLNIESNPYADRDVVYLVGRTK